MLRDGPAGAILSFTSSSGQGAYVLPIPEGRDTLWISVTHLSYAGRERVITEPVQQLDWVLSPQVYELPEMEVRQEAVIRRGDTLIFDVNQLREAQDETIEQVLSRIPGITIQPNGKILYQDLEISKFYIEGLDLLEGRYALATRNLNIDAIRDIEILERHQPIRALDSIFRPPNAAVNLRLKSGIAVTGQGTLGTGAAPALYQGKASVFGFQKEQQFNLLGSANNTGEVRKHDFRDLYREANAQRSLVSPTKIIPSFLIPPGNAIDNREWTGGFNFLRKTGRNGQLKWQAFAAKDRLFYQGRNELIIRDNDSEVRFDEILRARETPWKVNNRLIYELNADRFYTKASVEGQLHHVNTDAGNVINGLSSAEQFEQSLLDLGGRLHSIFRKGKKAYELRSRFDFRDDLMDLLLLPLDVYVTDFPPTHLDRALQNARQKTGNSDTYTNFLFRHKQLKGQIRIGLKMHWQQITSDLFSAGQNENTSLGSLFQNDVRQRLWTPYVTQDYIWERKKGRWRLTMPLSLDRLQLEGGLHENTIHQSLWVMDPQLEYIRRLPFDRTLTLNYTFSRDYNQDQLFYNGYILSQNRQFDRSLLNVNRFTRHELSARFQGQTRRLGISYNSYLSLSAITADFLVTTIFNELGQASSLQASRNTQQRLEWQNRFAVSPFPGAELKLETDYRLAIRPSLLNGNEVTILTHAVSLRPFLSYALSNSVLSCKPQVYYYGNSLSDLPVRQAQLEWVFFHRFKEGWGKVNLSFNQYWTWVGSRKVANNLFNIRYENRIPSTKLDVSLQLNNLTGAGYFVSFTQNAYFEEMSFFQLRPRQVIVAVSRKF